MDMDDQLKNQAEQVKGRAKEAAGVAVDDDGLKAEGSLVSKDLSNSFALE